LVEQLVQQEHLALQVQPVQLEQQGQQALPQQLPAQLAQQAHQ
jgi:hypothetical protein